MSLLQATAEHELSTGHQASGTGTEHITHISFKSGTNMIELGNRAGLLVV